MAELDIEKLKSCTAIKQIPILTLDERWYHLITDKLKTDEICYWEKQVNELLKKQGQVNNDIKEVKKIKNQLIQDVVDKDVYKRQLLCLCIPYALKDCYT